MAYPDDFNPYGAPFLSDDDYSDALAAIDAQLRGGVPSPGPAPMQPGIGIPASAVDAAAAAVPDEIEMPVDYVGKPTIGQPRPMPPDLGEFEPDYVNAPRQPVQNSPDFPSRAPGETWDQGSPLDAIDAQLRAPDAISGGRSPSQVDAYDAAMRGENLTGGYTTDELARDPSFADQVEGLAYIAENRPDDYLRLRGEHAQKLAAERIARQREIAAADAKRATEGERMWKENFAKAQAMADEVEREAKTIAATEVDPDRWWNDRSTAQKVSGLLAALLGGLTMHRNGRNIGLDAINAEIDRDIDAQKANLSNKRADVTRRQGLVSELFQRTGDIDRAADTARIAARERALQQLELDMQAYDLEGTTRFRVVEDIRSGRAEIAGLKAKLAENAAKRQQAADEAALKQREATERERHNRAAEATDRTRAGADWMRAKAASEKDKAEAAALTADNAPVSVEELKRLYPTAPPDAFNIGPTSPKKFAKHLETFGKGSDIAKGAAEATVKQADARLESSGVGGSPYAIADQEGNAIKRKGGTGILEIKDDTRRRQLKDLRDASVNIRKIADLYGIMRKKYGGASEALGSDEYQEFKSLVASTNFETFKAFGLGAPSEGDKAMADDIRGGKDPTSFFHDSTSGFKAYADNIESKLNTQIIGEGGEPIKLKKTDAAQSYERTEAQNVDVWNQPSTLRRGGVKDEGILSRAAQRAADSADALARQQKDPYALKALARDVRARVDDGTFTKDQGDAAMKPIRREFKRHIKKVRFGTEDYLKLELGTTGPIVDDEGLDELILKPVKTLGGE